MISVFLSQTYFVAVDHGVYLSLEIYCRDLSNYFLAMS